jgi:hypothetical protein
VPSSKGSGLATIIDRMPPPSDSSTAGEPIHILPTTDVPYPIANIAAPNPVASIVQGLELNSAVSFFSSGPSAARALVSNGPSFAPPTWPRFWQGFDARAKRIRTALWMRHERLVSRFARRASIGDGGG